MDRTGKEVVAEGWNRKPKGCEDRFRVHGNEENEPFEKGKRHYGKSL